MGQGVSCLQPLILDHGAAFVAVAHGADIRHSQRVTALVSAEVLFGSSTKGIRQEEGVPPPTTPSSPGGRGLHPNATTPRELRAWSRDPFSSSSSSSSHPNRSIPRDDLSGQQDGSVVVLRVPVARGVEPLLPATEVAQGEPTIVGHLRPCCLLIHHQHLHHHQVNGVLQAGVFVDASGHGHQRQDVVLWGKNGAGKARVKTVVGPWFWFIIRQPTTLREPPGLMDEVLPGILVYVMLYTPCQREGQAG